MKNIYKLDNNNQEQIGALRRWIILIITVLEAGIFGGIIFGFAQLSFVLKSEGIYGHLCANESNLTSFHKSIGCEEQDERLALVYTISCVVYGTPSVFVGLMLHHVGLAVTRVTSGILLVLGFTFLGLSSADEPDWLYYGMCLLALGGNQLRMSGLQSANLFPRFKATALSIISGAFSASAGIFIFIQWAGEFGVSLQYCCYGLAILASFSILVTILVPRTHIPDQSVCDVEITDEYKSPSIWESIWSLSSLTYFYWYFVCMNGVVLFVTYFNSWISKIATTTEEAANYSKLFSYMQFMCPFLPPVSGFLIDFLNKKGQDNAKNEVEKRIQELKSPFLSISIITVVVMVLYTCILFNTSLSVYIGIICLFIARPCVPGIGIPYLRFRFPSEHFNRLIGFYGTLVSIFTMLNYLQYRWSQYDYMSAQIFVLVMIGSTLVHPLHLLSDKYNRKVALNHSYSSVINNQQEVEVNALVEDGMQSTIRIPAMMTTETQITISETLQQKKQIVKQGNW